MKFIFWRADRVCSWFLNESCWWCKYDSGFK